MYRGRAMRYGPTCNQGCADEQNAHSEPHSRNPIKRDVNRATLNRRTEEGEADDSQPNNDQEHTEQDDDETVEPIHDRPRS